MKAPDRWLVIRVPAPDDEERRALLASLLVDIGGRAVLEEGGDLVTHVPAPDDLARWRATVARPIEAFLRLDAASHRRKAGPATAPCGSSMLSLSWQDHEEWAELWKVGLEPRRIGRRLVVTPSWCTPQPRAGDIVVTVDPGMAFGNAEHGTTRGSMRLLEQTVREGDRILDVGTGSGILAIVAAHLGASGIRAVEADPWAAETARENIVRNGVADRVTVEADTVTEDRLSEVVAFDGVMANLEWGLLEPLLDGLAAAACRWLLLSGMQTEEWPLASGRCEPLGWRCVSLDRDDGWCSARLERRYAAGPR